MFSDMGNGFESYLYEKPMCTHLATCLLLLLMVGFVLMGVFHFLDPYYDDMDFNTHVAISPL